MKKTKSKSTVITPPRIRKAPLRKPDKYDRAIAFLNSVPKERKSRISCAWNFPYDSAPQDQRPASEAAGCLFVRVNRGSYTRTSDGRDCGCLTQIAARCGYEAETPELTDAIHKDKRIPIEPNAIKKHHLPLLAAWQRKIDRILNRK